MGNKHSSDITNPCIQSYTQHPDGYVSSTMDRAPRRNSFTAGFSTLDNTTNGIEERKKLATSKSLYVDQRDGRDKPRQQSRPGRDHVDQQCSRPGTNDSGYFTTACLTDSDKSERARLRGSRTSLNEALFCVPPPPMPMFRSGPPPDAFAVGLLGPPPMMPMSQAEVKKMKKWRKKKEKAFLSRHESMDPRFPPPPMPPFGILPGPPPPDPSFLMYRARSMDNLNMAAGGMPPFMGPPPMQRTLDPRMMRHPDSKSHHHHPQQNPRRFASQTDLRFGMMPTQPPGFAYRHPQQMSPPVHIEGKYDKRGRKLKESKKEGSVKGSSLLGSKAPSSSRSGRNSRNNDDANTKFEEERLIKPMEQKFNNSRQSKDNDLDTNMDISSSTKSPPPDVIYETLKATRQRTSTLLTTADIEFEAKRETRENILNISFEKPTDLNKNSKNLDVISSTTNIETNNNKLADNEKQTTDILEKSTAVEIQVSDQSPEKSTKTAPPQKRDKSIEAKSDSLTSTVSSSSSDKDSTIEAVLNPTLQKRKIAKPENFEALKAWRDIKVDPSDIHHISNPDIGGYYISENIVVKLVDVAPLKKDQQNLAEPIYQEYDERLPEFKKRLIETGSFDFPEIDQFHHQRSSSQFSEIKLPNSSRKDELDYLISDNKSKNSTRHDAVNVVSEVGTTNNRPSHDVVTTVNNYRSNHDIAIGNINRSNHDSNHLKKTSNSDKGSLKRLKDSVVQMFANGNNTDKTYSPMDVTNGTTRITGYHERSLTPTTAKIKAGDSSEIDFSWVHDLETRFRHEREQFERELETRKRLTQNNADKDYANRSHENLDCRVTLTQNSYPEENDSSNFASLQRQISNNVRAKTAMFESEAQRLQREMDLKRKQMTRQKRSLSTPVRPEEEPIYIPKPDYEFRNPQVQLINPLNEQNGGFSNGGVNRIKSGYGVDIVNQNGYTNGIKADYCNGNGHQNFLANSQIHIPNEDGPRRLNRCYQDDQKLMKPQNGYNTKPVPYQQNGFAKPRENGFSRMNGYENGISYSDLSGNNLPQRYVSQPILDCNVGYRG